MDTSTINSRLETVEKALRWIANVPAAEQLRFREKLVNLRREYKRIRFAVEERPSVAAFGESQMGKSYLVSAMLSTPDAPFAVTDGQRSFNFINDINPSSPNSTIEATGVITRFTTHQVSVPAGTLRARLLSVADVVLVLCEAYYNQVDYSHESIISIEQFNERLSRAALSSTPMPCTLLDEDDLMDIRDYLFHTSSIQKKCDNLLKSQFFTFLLQHLREIDERELIALLKLTWNDNRDINRIFDNILDTYRAIGFKQTVYVEFAGVLKRHGSLLDVARLDEMYGEPEVSGADFIPDVNVLTAPNGSPVRLPKSFFSALIAELTFTLPAATSRDREFLNDIDILDFPGARRPEQIKESKLPEGKNLSTILRRGKVSYFFNKYSMAKRITALLFCHNNNQSAESTMGVLLNDWVTHNVGNTTAEREAFTRSSGVSPLFIIATWFNKDLEYQNEKAGDPDRLNERWPRRFKTVLEKEVLKSIGDSEHWFNRWTDSQPAFNNIFMLRDFKYSTMIFEGYNPESGQAESRAIVQPQYPNFLDDLRHSFVNDDFVRAHFANPDSAWQQAATVGNDGTKPIIAALCHLAPNASAARLEKLSADFNTLDKRFKSILEQYYHPEDSDRQLKQAKRQAGAACLTIDRELGNDPYFFGRLIGKLMISETELYELIHRQILGAALSTPMNTQETSIYMGAGLDASVARDENIERLCDYLGTDDEDECRDELAQMGIDLDKLLSQDVMVSSEEEQLVSIVEKQWHDDFLAKRCSAELKDSFPPIDIIVSKLWTIYKLLHMHDKLVERVKRYMRDMSRESCVGIIADYLAMQLNAFVNSFGYDFLPAGERESVIAQNERLRLGLNTDVLLHDNDNEGLGLLADLDKKNDLLSTDVFSGELRDFLLRFPQYKNIWQWQQKLRLAYVYACRLPDFDPAANSQLGSIISLIK